MFHVKHEGRRAESLHPIILLSYYLNSFALHSLCFSKYFVFHSTLFAQFLTPIVLQCYPFIVIMY